MDVVQQIARQASQAAVVLFLKGSPERPMSLASKRAVEILRACDAEFAHVDVQKDPSVRAFLPKFSASAACPQLFLQGEFIGDIEVIEELFEQGELPPMIRNSQLAVAS